MRASGDTDAGLEVALSWRLLMLHGGRRRRLTLAPTGASSAPRITPPAPTAQIGAYPADQAKPALRPHRTRRSGGGPRDRLSDLEHALDVVRRLVERHALRVAHVDGWLEFALHDVGQTGRAYGFLCALATLVDPLGRFALHPRWDTEDRLAADITLEVRVQPLRTLLVLLGERLRRRAPAATAAPRGAAGGSLAA